MLEKIKALEKLANPLEPTASERKKMRTAVVDYSEQFLENIKTLKAYEVTPDKGKKVWDFPISETGIGLEKAIELIQNNVDRPGLNPASGGHIAYIPGGGIYPASLGDYLADITNRYAGVFYGSPGAVRIENLLLRWMCDLFGFPAEAGGNLTSGGSIANLIAVTTARDHKQLKSKDFERVVIYSTAQVHHCTRKAIKISGLYEAIQRNIPMDQNFRMDAQALATTIAEDKKAGLIPFLVIASAGTTDTGAIDPLNAIADICEAQNLWFHVDGAYGGFFILSEEVNAQLKGIERADSIVIDPHKGLFLPYGSGAVLVRNAKWLYDSQHMEANYLQDAFDDIEELSPADLSPELTKPFRGLRMWLPLQLFGVAPFRACLSEKIWLCRYFYEAVQKIEGFEVGCYPDLSVMTYRYVPKTGDANAYNLALTNRVKEEGTVFISSTTIDGLVYLRLAVLSFRTHLDTINQLLQVLRTLTENEPC
ncbi:pyridoxal phosphate-dependent decarboxylase family protein [Aureispira anguillae]|uniref:Aminotransferase class V-fold PLP-dependent enzyme n=1 Tax=Aureispira anguillae TaxID=2864201 RepID=A0A915YF05_9BACT|nr:aminotransferase class V-fold PLP-dependent enzyme [Aureispira anguillae]BDS11918.1 aminotransferase class V-fold PLP-dependent enzyme [Aureispira anguillae]